MLPVARSAMTSVFLEQFSRVARERPEEVLLYATQEGRTWRARDLLACSDALRATLSGLGVRRGDAVLSTLGNQAAFVALALACFAEGWPLLAADRSVPVNEVQDLVARWGPTALVCAREGAVATALAIDAPLPPLPEAARLERHADARVQPLPRQRPPGRFGDAVLLKLTSGSTGVPKVTLTAERHLQADVTQLAEAMDIRPDTRQLGVIPLSHSYGFSNLLLPLLWQGSPLLLLTAFSAAAVAEEARRFSVETWAGVPFMFDHVARHGTSPFPPTIRTVISAGAPLSFETVQAFHAATGRKVHSFYGSSETGGICYDDSDVIDPDVPVGRPLGATEVTLVHDDDAPEGAGRVTVRGPGVVAGYADGEEPEAFADGSFITGDFGRWRADGALLLTGRASAVVNIAGRKVWPFEVEAALRAVPGVEDAVVMGVHDARRGQTLGACVVARRRFTPVELRTALASTLAPHKLPRVIVQVERLPRTDRGKPDRRAIAERLSAAAPRE